MHLTDSKDSEDWGQENRISDAARHRRRCEKQEEHKCSNCHFCTKNKEGKVYHVANKHAQISSKLSTVYHFVNKNSLQQNSRKEKRANQRKPSDTVADLSKIVQEEGEDGEKMQDEISACQHFLVETEMKNGSYKVF